MEALGGPECSGKIRTVARLAEEPVPLFLGERNDGEAADFHQRRIGKDLLGLDPVEALRILEARADLDADERDFGVGGVHSGHGAGADGGALVAGVVEDPLGAGLELAQVFDGGGIGDAVPDGLLVAQEVVEAVGGGLGLEEVEGHHRGQCSEQVYDNRADEVVKALLSRTLEPFSGRLCAGGRGGRRRCLLRAAADRG
jgi:hypothetical protein